MDTQVIKDNLAFRLANALLLVWVATAALTQPFQDVNIAIQILGVIVGLFAVWIAVAQFFFAGVYIFENRIEFRAWFRWHRVERDDVHHFFQGDQSFDKYKVGVERNDGSREEFKVPVRATNIRRCDEFIEMCEMWRDPDGELQE